MTMKSLIISKRTFKLIYHATQFLKYFHIITQPGS